MRISNTIPSIISSAARPAVCSLGLAWLALFSVSAQAANQNYQWSAKLMSFDEASSTAVVQAPIESYVTIKGIDDYSDGDRLILTWTGINWAAGVRDLAADPELTPTTLSLPVEFVSTELDGRYLNFRISVPSDAVSAIAAMEAGTHVTGTSPKMATDWSASISSLRHYNDVN